MVSSKQVRKFEVAPTAINGFPKRNLRNLTNSLKSTEIYRDLQKQQLNNRVAEEVQSGAQWIELQSELNNNKT